MILYLDEMLPIDLDLNSSELVMAVTHILVLLGYKLDLVANSVLVSWNKSVDNLFYSVLEYGTSSIWAIIS